MSPTFTISLQAQEIITQHAMISYPFECCGILLGTLPNISDALVLPNVSPRPKRHFEISARDYLQAESTADRRNLNVIGIFHSHCDAPALPSGVDLTNASPGMLMLIVEVTQRHVTKSRLFLARETTNLDQCVPVARHH